MKKLHKKLSVWVENNLISPEQMQNILSFEDGKESFFSMFYVLVTLGVFSIGTGIVSVISANWYGIPAFIKLATLFLFMSFVAIKTLKYKVTKDTFYEAGLLFMMLLFFAMIGLVGQIYHLKSDTYKAFLFWSVLSFPILCLSKKALFGYIWIPVFSISFMQTPMLEQFFRYLFENLYLSSVFFSFIFAVIVLLLINVQKAKIFVQPIRVYSFCMAIFCLMIGTTNHWYLRHSRLNFEYRYTAYFIATLVAVFLGWYFYQNKAFSKSQRQSIISIMGCYVLCFLIPALPFVNFVLQLFVLLSVLFAGYAFKHYKVVQVTSICIAIRILKGFFDLFGSLLETGFGLIFSGLLILFVSYCFLKLNSIAKQKLLSKEVSNENE